MNESVYQSIKMLVMIAGLTEETLASREISFLQQFRNTPTALENLDTDASHDGRHSSFFGWFDVEGSSSRRESFSKDFNPNLDRIFNWVEGKLERGDANLLPIDDAHLASICRRCRKNSDGRDYKIIREELHNRREMYMSVREVPSAACATLGYRVVRVRGLFFLPYEYPEYRFAISYLDTLNVGWRSFFDFERLMTKLSNLYIPKSFKAWRNIKDTRGTNGLFLNLTPYFLTTCSRMFEILMINLLQELADLSYLTNFLLVPQWACKVHKKQAELI